MAFNPFRAFRKHQKAIFAGLTIVCMLTFVFVSGVSGGGGFLDEVARWFGVRSRIPDAGTVYGRTVGIRDVQILQQQRRLANDFMALAAGTAKAAIQNEVEKNVPEFDFLLKDQLNRLQQQATFALMGFGSFADYARDLRLFVGRLEDLKGRLTAAKKPDDVQKIDVLQAVVERDFWRAQNQDEVSLMEQLRHQQQPLYFGGSLSTDGCLEFIMWQHLADRLGIKLSPDDVKKAIGQETFHILTRDQDRAIQASLRQTNRFGPQSLLSALGEEFRVRLAKDALMGQDPNSMTQMPAPVSPYELWNYYLENRTQVSVRLLPIPVSRFVAEVKTQPTEQELLDLYEKYKEVVPDPSQETPGFMQPRRIKVAWAEPSPESEYYRKQARKLLLSQVAALAGNPLQGAVLIAPLVTAYSDAIAFKGGASNYLKTPGLTQPDFASAVYTYKSLKRPETAASLLGLGANPSLGIFAAVVTAPARAAAREAAESAAAVAEEAKSRLPFSVTLLGAGGSPLPNLTFAATWLASEQVEEKLHLPLAAVKNDLLKDLEGELAKKQAELDETGFKDELEKLRKELGKQPDKFEAAAAKFVKEWIERHQWKHGESSTLRDLYDIDQDPGLKLLRDAYMARQINDPKGKRFRDAFFSEGRFDQPKPEATADRSKLYTPQDHSFGDLRVVFWRTQDQAPETLPFDKVRAKVVEAWRFDKARALAQAEADRIAKEARKSKDPLPVLREAAKKETLIDIDGIARLSRTPTVSPQFTGVYGPYQVPETKIEYPSSDFVDKVLDLKQVNDVTVLTDRPKDIYYVAVLTNRSEPEMREFREAALLSRLQQERRMIYRLGTMDELRRQAKLKVSEEGRKMLDEKGSNLPE